MVHAFLEAFNRGDVDAALGLLTDDVDLRPPSHMLDGVVFRGHAGVRAWVKRTEESWRKAEASARELATVGEHLVLDIDYRLIGHGSGAPVLCIHGAGSSALVWADAVEKLARVGRVIAYDRRGCSRSERPAPYERTSVGEHADDAAARWRPTSRSAIRTGFGR